MIFISSLFNTIPSSAKDLLEFDFFLTVGITAVKIGLLLKHIYLPYHYLALQ